jgi:hypothetical protein
MKHTHTLYAIMERPSFSTIYDKRVLRNFLQDTQEGRGVQQLVYVVERISLGDCVDSHCTLFNVHA